MMTLEHFCYYIAIQITPFISVIFVSAMSRLSGKEKKLTTAIINAWGFTIIVYVNIAVAWAIIVL